MPATYDWDPVDEASDQSFPASDPPAHGAPTDEPFIAQRLSRKRVGIAVAIAGALVGAVFLVRHLRA